MKIQFNTEINGQIKTIKASFESTDQDKISTVQDMMKEFIIEAYGSPAKVQDISELRQELLELVKEEDCQSVEIKRLKLSEQVRKDLKEYRTAITNRERWTVFSLARRLRHLEKYLTENQYDEMQDLCDSVRESL